MQKYQHAVLLQCETGGQQQVLDTRASIASKVSGLRVFALEVLDNLLTNEIKPVVLPILDDLSVSERLAQLDERFPQVHMNAQDRFEDLVSNPRV